MTIFFAEWNAEYEKYMINTWQQNTDVVLNNKLMKHFRDINLTLYKRHIPRKWFIKLSKYIKLRKLKNEDILVCNGFSICGFIDLVKTVQCHRVLIIRDTIDVLNNAMKVKKKWMLRNEDYIEKIIPYFDRIYSFDFDDCKKYNFVYLNQFLPFSFAEMKRLRDSISANKHNKKICYFIGEYWDDRAKIIDSIAPMLNKNNCFTDFNLINYNCEEKPNLSQNLQYYNICHKISYFENIEKAKHSDIILEITQKGQTGITLRAIEAILLNKKLITNNKSIKNYDFYSKDQVFILDDNENLNNFLKSDFKPVPINNLYKYSSDAMLETIKNTFISNI